MSIQQINSNFEAILSAKGITPGVRDEQFVEALVYVVLPLTSPHLRNRGGANPTESTIFFDGAFMSTCAKAVGRNTQHTSLPFMMFMTDKARLYAPAFGSTKRTRGAEGYSWETQLESINWNHTVTGDETTRVNKGEKIPYNFRLSFTPAQLMQLGVNGGGSFDTVWSQMKKLVPAMQPQLHLILSVSVDTMNAAKAEMVHGQDRYAMKVDLKGADVLECQWVLAENPLYDKAANLPTMVVDHRSNFERVEGGNTTSTIAVSDVGLSNPEASLRKIIIKKVNAKKANSPSIISAIVGELDGKLGTWWKGLSADKQAQLMQDYSTITPKGVKTVAVQKEAAVAPVTIVQPVVVEAQKEAAVEVEEFDFSDLDALLNEPIEVAAPAPKPVAKPTVKVGGNVSAMLSTDDFSDLDEI